MKEIIRMLHEENYSCVILNKGVIRTFSQRGVADLFYLLKNDPDFLKGALIADKIVGKAAASLMILGGIKEVYTDIISSSALALFQETNIEISFAQEVPYIQNRDQTDWCPMEKICYERKSVEAILPSIEEFIEKMKNTRLNLNSIA
ncbi:DUF1893 domain-containing protein [Dysgonomonas sp. ZJ709]|uniref:DUF1893 domain-containing protein n=1 Tax=Dysgonomonas sp. ZJ709 TaxID=2709797 RepID=UPI0013ECF620|nr:DUF1893 domain-containing protein [Dysgonomonas sp. ZJ709]